MAAEYVTGDPNQLFLPARPRRRIRVPPGLGITMARGNLQVEHLLRRAAFGPNAQDLIRFGDASPSIVSSYLLDYERAPDDVE